MEEKELYDYNETIDLRELLATLMERWVLIFLVTIAAAVIGFCATTFLITPQYEASVNMIVNSRQDTSSGNLTNDNITSAKNLVSTYAIILKSNTVLDEVIDSLDLNMNYGELYDAVTVQAIDNTQVMKVSVRHADPQIAANIVSMISAIAPDVIVDAVEAGSCKVISKVTAGQEPVSPNVLLNTSVAAVVGIVLAVGVVLLRSMFQNYIKDDSDVQKYLGLPVLGVIPEIAEGR